MKSRVITISVGLTEDKKPILCSERLHKGGLSFRDRIREYKTRDCVLCEREKSYLSGEFSVGVTEWSVLGLRLYRRVDFVNFRCLKCLHERNPQTYPYPNMEAAYGSDTP